MNQFGGSRTDTLIKLVLLFFTSLLSFSVGTFVGKQFSDSKKQLASIEAEFEEGQTTASIEDVVVEESEVAPEEVITEADLEELDIAKLEEEAKNEKRKIALEDEKIKAEIAKTKEIIESAAARIMKEQAPMKPHKAAPRGPANFPNVVAASTIGKYTIQIASYSAENEAVAHAEKLKNQGLSAFYVPANVKGKTWFRVSIGTYPDYNSAKEKREFILKQANIKSAIIQKIVK